MYKDDILLSKGIYAADFDIIPVVMSVVRDTVTSFPP